MKPIEKQFAKYVIPSMITVLLGGTFAFVDGVFIGQGTGDLGLTAVNLVAPIASLVTSLATGIGMGGSIIMSIYAGNKDNTSMQKARGATISILAILSALIFIIGLLFSKQIVHLLGADNNVFQLAYDYLRVILIFACFQMFSSGLSNLVINSGKSVLAMLVMVTALIINIILDWLFVLVFQMGTLGTALATIIGQAFSAFVYTFILLKDKQTRPTSSHLKLEKSMVIKIAKTGCSPLGVQLAPSIVVMCINYACIWTNGSETLATFAVLNQLILAIQILFIGIGNGIQPIISYCTGAKKMKAVFTTFWKAILFMIATSIILILGIYFSRFGISHLFNASLEVSALIPTVLKYLLFMVPFIGFNRLLCAFFFASSQNNTAAALTYIDPLVISPICLFLFCIIKGSYGIWPAMLTSQIVLSIIGLYLITKQNLHTNK